MDAVVEYLPSPKDRDHSFAKPYATNKDLCALSFKIQHDAQKGPLTFVRIYCGSIETVSCECIFLKPISNTVNCLSRVKSYITLPKVKQRNLMACLLQVRTT